MTRRGLITGSLLVCFTAVLTVIALGLSGPITAETVLATSKAPAQHCALHDAANLAALRQGSKRAIVVVRAFQPTRPSSAGLVVSLLSADKSERHQLARFAVHPLRAFTAQEPGKQQRFLVSLGNHAQRLEDGKPLCFEIGFDTSSGKVERGMAEIDIELVDMTAMPAK
jgi:hypothetical protein